MALALWLVVGERVREVRRRVCAWQVTRESTSSWPTLRLVEAVLTLAPMQRAALGAMILGSLADELVDARAMATLQRGSTRKRQHTPAPRGRKQRS